MFRHQFFSISEYFPAPLNCFTEIFYHIRIRQVNKIKSCMKLVPFLDLTRKLSIDFYVAIYFLPYILPFKYATTVKFNIITLLIFCPFLKNKNFTVLNPSISRSYGYKSINFNFLNASFSMLIFNFNYVYKTLSP